MKKNYFLTLLLFISFLYSYGQNTGDFRSNTSITSGWSSITSWETYDSVTTTWSSALTYPGQNAGTYSVTILIGDEITISSNLSTASMGDLTINGILDLQGGTNPKIISIDTKLLNISSTGVLNFSNQKTELYLPQNAVIKIDSGGDISGACTNNTKIYIDNKLIAVCNGGGGNISTFGEVVAGSGTLNANITTPIDYISTICNGINIQLEGESTGSTTGTVNYLWTVKDFNYNDVSISNNTSTSTLFTPSIAGEYSISFTVSDGSYSNTETKTVIVQGLVTEGSIGTSQNICYNSTPATLTSISAGTATGTITYEWQTDASGSFVTIPSVNTAHYSPHPLTKTTNYQRRTVSTQNGVICYSDYTTPVTITVDNIEPTITCPTDIFENNTPGSCGKMVTYTVPVGIDNCSGAITTQTSGLASGAIFPIGITTNTFEVTDTAGNKTSCSFTVTVADNQVPVISCPIATNANRNVNTATCTYTAVGTEFNATATDNCAVTSLSYTLSGATSGTGTSLAGIVFNKGTTTVTWSATDGVNATVNCDFTVTVVDSQNPTIATVAAISVNADSGLCTYASSQLTKPTALDNCSIASVIATPASLALGANTVTWTATDGSGKTATSTQTVTVVDSQNPTIATVAAISVNADSGLCTYDSSQLTKPTAADNCSVASVIATPASLALGANTVTWTATDGSGKTATSTQTVTVVDSQNPTIATVAAISVNADSGLCTYASSQLTKPTALDNCSIASVIATPASLALGTNTVTWTATDGSGKTATSTQTVTVVDSQNPTIATIAAISVNADSGLCTYDSSQLTKPTAADNCSVASVIATPASLALGANTVTWTVTDGSGKTATSTQTVTVVDSQNPTIATVAAISVNADSGLCTYDSSQLTKPTAADNCSVASVIATPASLTLGTNTVTWTVTDGSGKTATSTQTVTVVDSQNPTIATVAAISVNADSGLCTYDSSQLTKPTALDNCSVASVIATPASLTLGANTVTWTVTDGSGKTATSTQTVTVVDSQNPTIATVAAISVNADSGLCTYASSQLTKPTALDNCSIASVIATPASLALGANTVTWTATDGSGKTATSTQTVTVVDSQNPTIATVAAISVNADSGLCTYDSSQLTKPTAADNCSVASVIATPASLALGANTVTWTATDGSGKTATSTQTVTVVDSQNPTIATVAAISVNADSGLCTYDSSQLTKPTALDNCSIASVIATPASLTLGANTVTWTATDGSGKKATSTQTVTVVDSQNPTIATVAAISVNADSGLCTYASSQLTKPTAADNCSVVSIVATPASLALGANTVTWTVTDGSGKTATSTQTVTVVDSQNPTIATVAAISVNADSGLCTYDSSQLTKPTAADNCSITSVIATPASLALGANTVTWTATDGSGKTATSTQTVTVVDSQNPTIATVAAISVNADSGLCTYDSSQLTKPTAADNCSITSVIATPASLALGANTVTWTATDGSGKTATSTQTVTVVDSQNPTIATVAAISVNADSGLCTYASSQLTKPTAADNCSIASVIATPASLTLGANTVTWTATDGSGKTATSTQTVTVVDSQNPTIATVAAISVNADSGLCTYDSSQLTKPTALDNCSIASVIATPASLALGTNTVTWTATDGSGKTATSTQTVTVVDSQNPTIATVAAISVNADSGLCTYASSQLTKPTAADNCSIASVIATPASLTLGANTVTWTATDGSGKTATSTQTVTVVDSQNPTIATVAAISVNADSGLCTYDSSQLTKPTALDNCSIASVIATPASLALGTNTVTWTATDGSGKTATSTQTVTVVDSQNPTIATVAAISVNADSGLCTYASSQLTKPTAADNCSITSVIATPASLALGANTVTWTATDGSGKTATSTQTVTVVDSQNPTIATVAAISVNADSGLCTYDSSQLTKPTAADNCSVVSIVATPASLTLGANTVTWTATDGSGKTATSTQTVTVVDSQNPTIATVAAISVNADSGLCTYDSSQLTKPTAADNCSVVSIVATPASLTLGANTVTWTATDGSGKTATSTQTVTVVDSQNPTIATVAAISVNADSGLCTYASSQLTKPTAADNCSIASVIATPASLALGANTVTWTATDTSGNTKTSLQTVTIKDNVIPIITTNGNKIVNNDPGKCGATVTVSATATDNCSVGLPTGTRSDGLALNADYPIGITNVTWNVTDINGNIAETKTHTVTVKDNTPPSITSLPALSANCSITISVAPTSADNCGTITGVTSDIILPYTFSTPGFYIVGWNFTDASGNSTNISQSITVIDNAAPVPNVTNLQNLNFTGCELLSSQLTYPTAEDACNGTITGVPNILFPYNITGTSVITWTYTDATGNTSSQNQNITMTSETISGGTLKGYLTVDGAASAKTQVDITSCSSGGNEIKMNLSGQVGTIVQWEKYGVGNAVWVTIPNTNNNYTTTFYPATTESTYFRALVKVGSCYQYSSSFYVRALPTDKPPILSQSLFNICLNQSVTLVARRGYTIQEDAIAGKGGDYDQGQLNTQDPNSWLVDGKPGGFTAGGNNTSPRNWSATNDHKFGDITYDSQDKKFAITSGNHNTTTGSNKYTGANPAIIETPIFSLAKTSAASLDFDQAYYFATGDLAIIYISTDGGVNYSILKTMHAVGSPQLDWYHDPNVTAAQKAGATATQYNFKNDNTSIPLTAYLGQTNLRIKWAFRGTTDDSVWAMDNISIPTTPVLDQIEWTDGIGNPGTPPITDGQLETSFTLTPEAPGKHQYGATVLVDGCRSYDASGTALADVNVSYSYAGDDTILGPDACGSNTVKLNAYDNSKTANQNAAKGSYTTPTGCTTCDDLGTGSIGAWSITGSSTCGSGSFSNINDPDATFTGEVGSYVLTWTVNGCTSSTNVTISNCATVDFDGTNDYVDFKKQNYDLNADFSIEVWFKTTETSSNIQTIFSKRNGNVLGDGYDLRVQNDFVTFRWNATGSITSPFKTTPNRWYHAAVTYTNSEYKLYIDGLLMVTKSGSSLPIVNKYRSLLGAMDQDNNAPNNPVNYFKGWIDELRIWNVALSDEQIHQMMNQEIKEENPGNNIVYGEVIPMPIYGLTWTNLKGYYRMDQFGCGYLNGNFGVGVDGKLKNITSSEPQTAPLPYYSVRDGDWTNTTTATPWAYGNSVWDFPNSTGINGQPIDWNIVRSSKDINSNNKDITLLGLISQSGEITMANPSEELDEKNNGNSLWLTHYFKLDGSIDLVGESQLIQKRYTTTQYSESIFEENSSGYIERDQQGKQNSFNYNYWSSPVSKQGAATNSNFTISDVLRDGKDSSEPKTISFGTNAYFADGALTSPIKISNRWIWSYKSLTPDSNSNWQNYYQWIYKANTGLLGVAEGFTMKGSGGSFPIEDLQNYVFTGKPNSGTISLFLAVDQTYLVGNPYPSALDATAFIKDNIKDCSDCRGTQNTFGGALYFWDHFGLSNNHILAQYEGGYSTYTIMGGVKAIANDPLNVNNGAVGSRTPQRYIPVGQGFFIDAAFNPAISGTGVTTAVQGGTVVFKNSQRFFVRETGSSPNSIFMKKTNEKSSVIEDQGYEIDNRSKIRLGFYSAVGDHRQLLLGTDPNTSNQFDLGYDAIMLGTNKNDMYWELQESELVIQALPEFNDNQIIPLGINLANIGNTTIKIDALENIPTTRKIYLFDNKTGIYHDIKNNNYTVSLPIGKYKNRFSLQFVNKLYDISKTALDEAILVNYTNKNGILNIKNKFIDATVNKVYLFNILGQNITNWEVDDIKQSNIQIPIINLSSGVYIVKISTSNGDFSKKIIIR